MQSINSKLLIKLIIINLVIRMSLSQQSISIKIVNRCSSSLSLKCDNYPNTTLELNQVFGFSIRRNNRLIIRCNAKCSNTSEICFDAFGGRAPKRNNNWETNDDAIYLVNSVKYYKW
jgi:hypothetical protein